MSNLVAEQLSSSRRTPSDLAVLFLVFSHLFFSLAAAIFILHFHFRSISPTASSSSPSPSSSSPLTSFLLRRRRLLRGLNSLWPVRLLLVLFASLFYLSELLRLPLRRPSLCKAYALSSQSFAQPAFLATLLFLLRASTHHSKPLPLSLASASAIAAVAGLPFVIVHSLFLFLWPWILRNLLLPPDNLSSTQTDGDRCTHPLYGTFLLALLAAGYVPVFVSACWTAVKVVINKKLRVKLYALAAVVVLALSAQVATLSLSAILSPSCTVSEELGVFSFAVVLVCVAVGEGIMVIQPVVDALAIVMTPEAAAVGEVAWGEDEEGECLVEV